MKKFYLFCSAGMSTSILAKKMQDCASSHNLDVEVKAFSINVMDDIVQQEHLDCILLGPQVNYVFEKTQTTYPNIPVMVINMAEYGAMDGEAVLKSAIMKYKTFTRKDT